MTHIHSHIALAVLVLASANPQAALAAEDAPTAGKTPAKTAQPRYETLTLRGRVTYLAEVLERRHGVRSVDEAAERQLVLETAAGAIHPLVEDVRGRAFRVDPTLRQMEVELLVRRYPGSPAVQTIQVFAVRDGEKYELDYWCDVCAIAMYELKSCECCQEPNYLRERLVEKPKPAR